MAAPARCINRLLVCNSSPSRVSTLNVTNPLVLAGVAWLPAGFLAVVFGLLAALLLLPRPWNWAVVALNLATVLLPLRLPPPRWAARFLRFSIAESRRCELGRMDGVVVCVRQPLGLTMCARWHLDHCRCGVCSCAPPSCATPHNRRQIGVACSC